MSNTQHLMTPSPSLKNLDSVCMTANEVIALPDISPNKPQIGSFALLHWGQQASAVLKGKNRPILEAFLKDKDQELKPLQINLDREWLPIFRFADQSNLSILCPLSHLGKEFLGFCLSAQGQGKTLVLRLAFQEQEWVNFRPRPAAPVGLPIWSDWTKTWSWQGDNIGLALRPPPNTHSKVNLLPNGEALLELEVPLSEDPIWISIGVGRHSEAAALSAVHLSRQNGKTLLTQTQEILDTLLPSSLHLSHHTRRNALFGHFFTHGFCIDRDEEVLLTSRSPRYYVSGAYWARDACWWTLPLSTRLSPATARRHLDLVFSRYLEKGPRHALNFDGSVLYDGFELDQLCWPFLAAFDYAENTGNTAFFKEPTFQEAVHHLTHYLRGQKDPKNNLFLTFLDSSDDPLPQGLSLMDNVLVWKVLTQLQSLSDQLVDMDLHHFRRALLRKFSIRFRGGQALGKALMGDQPVLADNPTLSLLLLPYFGFLNSDHPLFRQTASWILGPSNSHHAPGHFRGEGCDHGGGAWTMGWVSRILGGVDTTHGIRSLTTAKMDGGYACEAVNSQTGECLSGQAMASAAAFSAWPFLPSKPFQNNHPIPKPLEFQP